MLYGIEFTWSYITVMITQINRLKRESKIEIGPYAPDSAACPNNERRHRKICPYPLERFVSFWTDVFSTLKYLMQQQTTLRANVWFVNIIYYYPYRAFGGQNKIVYSTRFVRRAIFFKYCPGNIFSILPGLYVPNHLTENRAMPRPP